MRAATAYEHLRQQLQDTQQELADWVVECAALKMRKNWVALEDVEKAIDEEWITLLEGRVNLHDFLKRIRVRLAAGKERQ